MSTVALVSDLHINSTVALSAPYIILDSGQQVEASEEQMAIRDCWLRYWDFVWALERPLYVVVNGEGVDGIHHGTTELMTYLEGTQVEHACQVLSPIVAEADHTFVTRGTEVHSGKMGQWDELIAQMLGAEPDEESGTWSWWHLPLRVEDVLFDIMHHAQTHSTRPWLMDSAAARQASITWDEYHERGEEPPDVIVRSHYHTFAKGWRHETFCCFTPSWQLSTAYGRRRGTGRHLLPIGGAVFLCREGSWTWPQGMKHPGKLYRPKPRKPWTSPNRPSSRRSETRASGKGQGDT